MKTIRRVFTLLELMLVLTILALIAGSATLMVSDSADEAIHQNNLDRLSQLRDAICGNPSALTPSNPSISGYVADMGRLPRNINELLVQNATYTDIGSLTQPSYAINNNCRVGYGWRGPYLQVPFNSAGLREFRDAWGTINPVSDLDARNFGWNYPSSLPVDFSLPMQSYGRDGLAGGSGHDADIPGAATPLITSDDWRMPLSTLVIPTVRLYMFNNANTTTYHTNFLRNKDIRIGFLTEQNADLNWNTALGNACLDLVSDNVLRVTNAAIPTNRTITITPTAALRLSFSANNSSGQAKSIPCGLRTPVLLLQTNTVAGAKLKQQIATSNAAVNSSAVCRQDLIFLPRGSLPGSNVLEFDIYVP